MKKNLFLIVAYDIRSDRRRNRIVKILKDYGVRVNFSVFECRIRKEAFSGLKSALGKVIDRKTDSVLLYDLCFNCEHRRESMGIDTFVDSEPLKIITV